MELLNTAIKAKHGPHNRITIIDKVCGPEDKMRTTANQSNASLQALRQLVYNEEHLWLTNGF